MQKGQKSCGKGAEASLDNGAAQEAEGRKGQEKVTLQLFAGQVQEDGRDP